MRLLRRSGGHATFRIQHEDRVILDGFHEESKAPFALTQRNLGLKRLRSLLQVGDTAEALFVTGEQRVILARDHYRVLSANLQERLAVLLTIETSNRVRTAEAEGMGLGEFVPEPSS